MEKENKGNKSTDIITLAEGSGGSEMSALIRSLGITFRGGWKDYDDDSSTLDLGDGRSLVYTTDSYIVSPIFFPGADIGHLAMCGTINDLSVMGATPLGISLALVIEEGFKRSDLQKIMASIRKISETAIVPVVTGDTKIMERGKIDGIVINTSGVGIVKKEDLLTRPISPGDKVIISGSIGDHAVALLSKRFDYKTDILSDSKPLHEEISKVRHLIKIAKDPTRGGIASILNEICEKKKVGMILEEDDIPVKHEVKKVVEMLGLNVNELACEGRFVCVAEQKYADEIAKILRSFNNDAAVIGEITSGDKVVVQTFLGKHVMPRPSGIIVPRIC